MKIAIVGTGYVGLVTGTCFAETGHHVICVDNDSDKIARLKEGLVPIYEPGLEVLIERNTRAHRLEFTTELAQAVDKSEIVFLALPTPPGEDGAADLRYVLGMAAELGGLIKKYTLVVNKSTVPVGTGEKVKAALAERLETHLFDVVSNPEFLREGAAVEDFLRPDRVVIGSDSQKALQLMKELYDPFVRQGNPIYTMDLRSAELTKYAANAYLAVRISFMNEIARICDLTGANVDMVRIGMGSDNRIGKRFLFPGVGYGGSCFPKDVKALFHTAHQEGYHFNILDSVMQVNQDQKKYFTEKIYRHLGQNLSGKKIAIWGLSFKPNTDDIREAPALDIIEDLLKRGASVTAYDPEAMDKVRSLWGDRINLASDMYEALEDADALVLVTEWSEFRSPDLDQVRKAMRNPLVCDGRNVFEPEKMREQGFTYFSIGRP
jgi:UDPglucose 6-dehydrogenase